MPAPKADSTLLIVLGAGDYPKKPSWTNPALGASANAVASYMDKAMGLTKLAGNALNLFNDTAAANTQCLLVRDFLTQNSHASDLIVYYIGHGCFVGETYYMGVADTEDECEYLTAIESRKFSQIVRGSFVKKRIYIVVDACFAATVAMDWLGGDVADAVALQMTFTEGTALLAASSRDSVALAPRNRSYTLFTGALLDILEHGVDHPSAWLSLDNLYENVRLVLSRQDASLTRPELHDPRRGAEQISRLPLFPNPKYQKDLAPKRTLFTSDRVETNLDEIPSPPEEWRTENVVHTKRPRLRAVLQAALQQDVDGMRAARGDMDDKNESASDDRAFKVFVLIVGMIVIIVGLWALIRG